MGDLAVDTAVVGAGGAYTRTLSRDWDIWGPNGGYIAAVAMRAVGAHSDFSRPASFFCQFLGVAGYDSPVELTTTSLRKTKRAESVRVSMSQEGKPILEATAWLIGDVDGLSHDATVAPDVPKPNELKSIDELLTPEQKKMGPPFPFWLNFEERPIRWLTEGEWENRPAGDPVWRHWVRFHPTATFDDAFVDAARMLVTLDIGMWPSASQAYDRGSLTHIAPSLDLFCAFHRLSPESDWLLIDASSPMAGDGLVGGHGRVWDVDGKLLCSGGQQMLCRPAQRS